MMNCVLEAHKEQHWRYSIIAIQSYKTLYNCITKISYTCIIKICLKGTGEIFLEHTFRRKIFWSARSVHNRILSEDFVMTSSWLPTNCLKYIINYKRLVINIYPQRKRSDLSAYLHFGEYHTKNNLLNFRHCTKDM